MSDINIKIPKDFMNCSVTTNNKFVADTNNSNNWDVISFPLPEPEEGFRWAIKSNISNNVVLTQFLENDMVSISDVGLNSNPYGPHYNGTFHGFEFGKNEKSGWTNVFHGEYPLKSEYAEPHKNGMKIWNILLIIIIAFAFYYFIFKKF